MNLQVLFPTPVGIVDFKKELSSKEKDFLMALESRPNMGNQVSVEDEVLKNPIMEDLYVRIQMATMEYFKVTASPEEDIKLEITQSWVNYSKPGQYHHKHSHQNSFISGVFYIQTNTEDKIYFYRDFYQQLQVKPSEYNKWNSDSWWFEAVPNRLILFPSSLTHMVPTIKGDKIRASLSFNTFPIGLLGGKKDMTQLQIKGIG